MVRISLIILLFFSSLYGAGPITHLFLGEEYCRIFRIEEETHQRDFLLGTSFPDIRYITHLPRERTHFNIQSLNEVTGSSSYFIAGMKFHAWVDEVREAFVVASGIYEKIEPYADGRKATLLKFIEEQIIDYDGRKWGHIFGEVLEEEKTFASEEQIQKWHTIAWGALYMRPSWPIWGYSWMKSPLFGVSDGMLCRWSYLLTEYAKDPEFQGYVEDLLKHILDRMEQESFLIQKINS